MESKSKLLKERLLIKEDILSEAKKIGIDKLPFGFRSISSFIDGKTMDVHYNKHYKGYVEKLNKALSKENYGDVELENIVKSISKYNKTIRNNAGGAFNHALFWKMLSPKKQDIPKELKSKIIKEFGSINNFKKEFSEVAKDRFGSGWAWLVLTKNNRLKIMSTPNQDNPLMNIIDGGGFPILGLDVWEHAYYLKYQNKRDEYINNFWDVVNWEFVNKLYTNKTKTKLTESIKTKKLIKEEVEVLKSNGRLNPAFVQTLFKKVYPKCSPEIITDYNLDTRIESPCYGKIESDLCNTNYGVIGGKYAVSQRDGTGEWSVLNWFDANTLVSDMILDLYKKFNREKIDLKSWLRKMSKTLFGEDGKFTPQLADLILNPQTKGGTLNRGIEREKIAIDIFNSKYKDLQINQFCDGDIRDKYNGQDMFVTKGGVSKYVQVKPTIDLYESKDENGNIVYIFKSKNKYNPNNIHIFAFINNRNNYIFFDFKNVKIEDTGGTSKERFSYIFKPEDKKFQSPSLNIQKLNIVESKKPKKVLISESQKILIEKMYFSDYNDLITELCNFKTGDTIYCRFKNVVDNISGSEKNEVLNAADILIDFYYPEIATRLSDYKTQRNMVFGRGIVTKILELALQNDLPGNFVKAIASFIKDDRFDKSDTEKRLLRLKNQSYISTEKLDEFLSEVREKAYSSYESQLTGNYMQKYATGLSLDYKCERIDERNFIEVVNSVKNGTKQLPEIVSDLVYCITKNMKKANPIKADLKATHDYFYKNEKIFSSGDTFEVKMMDTGVDSYLSEFFSIFKSSKVIEKIRDSHLGVYNDIIDYLHLELFDNEIAKNFLEKIKKNLAGVFFEHNVVVPIKYIKLYWSNKGQKGCNEKRLSIRFKIVSNNVKSYIYNPNSPQLELNRKGIKPEEFKEIMCW